MARLLALLLLLLPPPLLLPLPLLPPLLPPLPPENASLSACPPGRFQCEPGAICFPREWRCDGHPDCEDEGDEWGCGTATPAEPSPDGAWVTPPRSSGVPPTGDGEASATPVPGVSVPSRSQGHMWILIVAALLSILVAVGSVAVWGLSKAKSRSDIFSLEKASREQLMPDKSQRLISLKGKFLPPHALCMHEGEMPSCPVFLASRAFPSGGSFS
ncbi:LOW QUALITY PROTEIN: CD320 antigen [Gavia stellata]|uniref:LOW QUALITY PROTEIN: CD320 antigen n=1 Tax=Gavia stellata TaxID=37040 RepID=UPI00289BFC47|nr:LOW QUALITY PROTEIN: CD320 antigen [Gavia stellata]